MIRKHLPNFITCLNALSGSIAVAFAFEAEYQMAAVFIALAAIFDYLDGFAARLLKSYSPMGKELDSLSDIISFGMAPAAMVYSYFGEMASFGILPESTNLLLRYSAFLITVGSALRLAKFNIDERQATSFIGLPTPANAVFWAFGIVGSFQWISDGGSIDPLFLLIGVLISSYLLVSPLPMFSLKFKHFHWKGNRIRFVFLMGVLLAVIFAGWSGLSIAILWYIALCICTYRHNK